MTSAQRLALLLPLANGDDLPPKAVRQRLFAFLQNFEARGLRLPFGHQQELWDVHHAADAELKAVQKKVDSVFSTGFMFEGPRGAGTEDITADDIRMPLTFPSLRFGVFSPPRGQRGHFALMIEAGRLRDLVAYLVMYLLATEEIAVSRCTAPQREHWAERCNRFVIWTGVGRPPKVCSEGCADRVKARAKHERMQRERKELAALRKAAQQRQGRKKR